MLGYWLEWAKEGPDWDRLEPECKRIFAGLDEGMEALERWYDYLRVTTPSLFISGRHLMVHLCIEIRRQGFDDFARSLEQCKNIPPERIPDLSDQPRIPDQAEWRRFTEFCRVAKKHGGIVVG